MNIQIFKNANGNVFLKHVLGSLLFLFKVIHVYNMRRWIYDPIFADTGGTVFE